MKRVVSLCAVLVAAVLAVCGLPSTASAGSPSSQGSRHARPSAYAWLNDYRPSDTYTLVEVRGMSPRAVVRTLGGVERRLPDETPSAAEGYVFAHMKGDYSAPSVVQVERLGHAVVVYGPYFILRDRVLARLGRHGTAVGFFTDVEEDTYLTVARHGRVVRQFDAGFRPPSQGALPQEKGLDWGARHENIWATAWAFEERLSLTHVTRRWFDGTHPTVVLAGKQV